MESDDRLVQEVQSAELTAASTAAAWRIVAALRPFIFGEHASNARRAAYKRRISI
jgi:hypothetical protein